MKTELLDINSYKTFEKVSKELYKYNKFYRSTEASVEKMLLTAKSTFSTHSIAKMFIIRDNNDIVGRFALINDFRLKEYAQISFFEAQENLGNIFQLMKQEVINHFPNCTKIVVGLNGHLNYGAGILLNKFDEVPLFGLPYNMPYYSDYFKELTERKMFTFKFTMEAYHAWAETYNPTRKIENLNIRFMNKKNIKKESSIYTFLNNNSFIYHPYWAKRDEAEDLELFNPFRFLLDNENLIIAEINNEPVGFYFWYPDFNQLVNNQREINFFDLLKFKTKPDINTFRFTEIGIIPKYQKSPVALALIHKSLPYLMKKNYKFCEGGFIFEENRDSIAFVSRIMQRINNEKPEPFRKFAVYETKI